MFLVEVRKVVTTYHSYFVDEECSGWTSQNP